MLEVLDGLFLRDVARAMLPCCGLDESSDPAKTDPAALARVLKGLRLAVKGGPTPDEAQAMRGGVAADSLNPGTLEARDHPGLHVCGEAVDVDGPCGGFNLHWAWASGAVAGAGAALSGLRGMEVADA